MDLSLETINNILQQGFSGVLSLAVTQVSDDKIIATAPITETCYRPGGFVHGGVYLALAETLAGLGSMLAVDREKYEVLGIQVSANHTSSAKSGEMTITATPIHKGRKTHIWNIDITCNNKLLSTVRVTNMVVKKV